MTTVDINEFTRRWTEIVACTAEGSEVIITEANVPRVRIVPLSPAQPRRPGLHLGSMEASADFDAPLPMEFWSGSS